MSNSFAAQSEFTEVERNAMRAYLQRCEVRLSTLHRIATAFISGAGLLLLIPVFFKDVVDKVIEVLLRNVSNQFPAMDPQLGWLLTLVLFGALVLPVFASLSIPLYGVYLLLKDIIHFYFTIYAPGFSENLLNPSFALTGVLFSVDEAPRAKQEIMRYQYQATQDGFMIPFSHEKRELYFESIIENTAGEIIPKSRNVAALEMLDVLPDNHQVSHINHFNAALGIARSLDRTLVQEVAVTEMSLVRHVLYLRRLMIRYVKTLLMFIWTAVISFMLLPFLNDTRFDALLMLSLGYLVWALTSIRLLKTPIHWIYRHRHEAPKHVDPQLTQIEHDVLPLVYISILATLVASVLSLVSQAQLHH